MTTPTPPQDLFRELTDLGNLVFNMLAGPRVIVKRWPSYHMVYLDIERLCRDVNQVTGGLARGFHTPGGLADAVRIGAANAGLARIDAHVRALADVLAHVHTHALVEHGNPALHAVAERHLAPDSAWYRAVQRQYCAGRISRDGCLLERDVLPIDPHPAQDIIDERRILEHQCFDLAAAQSCTRLSRTARGVQVKLNQVYAALGAFVSKNCPAG